MRAFRGVVKYVWGSGNGQVSSFAPSQVLESTCVACRDSLMSFSTLLQDTDARSVGEGSPAQPGSTIKTPSALFQSTQTVPACCPAVPPRMPC